MSDPPRTAATVAVIQARMGSTRLPGKVLRELGGRPVLAWVIRAAQLAELDERVVVATSTAPDDDAIVALAEDLGAVVVRGPSDDVLARYLVALDLTAADAIVRLTADCPLLDPTVIAAAADAFAADDLDYLSTVHPRTLPRGLDVEVAAADALRVAAREATGVDRVHVTSYLYREPGRFRTRGLTFEPPAPDLRVTLDAEEDAQVLDALVAELGDRAPGWHEVVAFLRARPDVAALNSAVAQKHLDEG